MHYLIDLAELQSSGWSDKAGIQYFNQSLRTPTNLGRSLTCFQTGLETLNGEWMYLPGQVERTVVRRQCSLLLVWYWGMALSHPPHNQSYHFLVLGKLNPVFPFLMLMLGVFLVGFFADRRWVLLTRQCWSSLLFTLSLRAWTTVIEIVPRRTSLSRSHGLQSELPAFLNWQLGESKQLPSPPQGHFLAFYFAYLHVFILLI